MLTGEPGVGKSALLDALAERADDMRLLRAAGVEYEAELPFSGLHELLHPVLELIEDLPAPQASALRGALAMSDDAVEIFAVFAAVFSLLAAAATDEPVLVCVDDAQWIDSASLEALAFAARRLAGDRVAIVAAFRDEVAPSFRVSRFEPLELRGLATGAVVTLVDRAAERTLSRNLVERVARATRGNPLAALEVAAAVSDDRLAGRIGVGEPLPTGRLISHAFERRLAQLSEPARRVLALAAAGESESTHVILAAATRLALPPEAFAEAERAGTLAVEENRLRFRHPLLRSLAYGSAPAEQRRDAHAALAAALSAAPGTGSERRAWHLAAAAMAPDEAVASALAAAAERFAQRTGYLAAAYAYERAAELTPEPAQRGERLVAAAEASRLAGRPARAGELLAEAAVLAEDATLRVDIALKEAMLEAWQGSVEVAAGRYADIAEEVMERDPDRGAFALSHAAGTAVAAGDTGSALASARRAAGLLTRPGVSGVDGVRRPRDARHGARPARRARRGCATAARGGGRLRAPRRACGARLRGPGAAVGRGLRPGPPPARPAARPTRAGSETSASSPPRSRSVPSSSTAPATGAPPTPPPRSPCGCRPTPSSRSSSPTASGCLRSSRPARATRPPRSTPSRPTRSPPATASR